MALEIDPTSISFSSIMQDITNWLATKPESAKWQDFYESSVGETIKELGAGISAYIAYQLIINRRETYLPHATNRGSVIAIAEKLGYSADRGTCVKKTLHVTPDQTIVIPKYTVIGSVGAYDIVAAEQLSLTNGVATTINVILGNLSTETITASSADLTVFQFTSIDVSEDIRLLLNGSEVPISDHPLDLDNDKYITLSNSWGAVDVLYLNDGSYNYITSDVFTLQYIELANVIFEDADLTFDYGILSTEITDEVLGTGDGSTATFAGTLAKLPLKIGSLEITADDVTATFNSVGEASGTGVTSGSINYATGIYTITFDTAPANSLSITADYNLVVAVSDYDAPETIGSIKVNAPVHHETQFLIKGRNDFLKIFEELDDDIADTNATDESSAMVRLTYVKDDLSTFSSGEKTAFLTTLNTHRPFGMIAISTILDPTQIDITMNIAITLADLTTSIATVQTDIDSIFDVYEKKFEEQLELAAIEKLINALTYVKVNRVELSIPAWVTGTTYNTASLIIPTTPNGFIYEAYIIASGVAGGSEPIWPTLVGETIADGGVTWITRDAESLSVDWSKYFNITAAITLSA